MEFSRTEYWMGSVSILQGILPTQGLNSGLLHGRWILYQLSYQGSPMCICTCMYELFWVCFCLFVCLFCFVLVAKSYPTFCDPVDCSLSGPLSMGFSRQEYWSGLPFSSPGNLPDPGIEPRSPTLQADALTSEPQGKPEIIKSVLKNIHYLKAYPTRSPGA